MPMGSVLGFCVNIKAQRIYTISDSNFAFISYSAITHKYSDSPPVALKELCILVDLDFNSWELKELTFKSKLNL